MDSKRVAVFATVALLLSSALFICHMCLYSDYPVKGDEASVLGDWQLTFVRECGNPDTGPEHFKTGKTAKFETYGDGRISGTYDGMEFKGSIKAGYLRFSIPLADGSIDFLGYRDSRTSLNVCAASFEEGVSKTYMLLFTRDGKMPHLTDVQPYTLRGKWISQSVYDRAGIIKDVTIDIDRQDVSVMRGGMELGGETRELSLAFTMLQNGNLYNGMAMDDKGNLWTVMAKKGLMVLSCKGMQGGEISDTVAYMVRDKGPTYLPVPADLSDKVYRGTYGYKADGTSSSISGYSITFGQNDCRFSGTLQGAGTPVVVAGIITTSLPIAAEVILACNGKTVHGTLYIGENHTIKMIMYDGAVPDGDFVHLEFRWDA